MGWMRVLRRSHSCLSNGLPEPRRRRCGRPRSLTDADNSPGAPCPLVCGHELSRPCVLADGEAGYPAGRDACRAGDGPCRQDLCYGRDKRRLAVVEFIWGLPGSMLACVHMAP